MPYNGRMCGRFVQAIQPEELLQEFSITWIPPGLPDQLILRYNVAPTQPVAAVRFSASGDRELVLLRWGLIPNWSRDPSIGSRMINARAESVARKSVYREAFRHRRCLIPASGFYEWRAEEGRRQAYYFTRKDKRPMAFGGLWDRWKAPDGEEVQTCTILTTDAGELVARIHNRMPVILPPDGYGPWLDLGIREARPLQDLLVSPQDEGLESWRVGTVVNDPANETPKCIEPSNPVAPLQRPRLA